MPTGLQRFSSAPSANAGASGTELEGVLDSIELSELIRLLTALNKSGRLELKSGLWTGEVFVEHGRVVAASLLDAHGVPALEAMLFAFGRTEFAFRGGIAAPQLNIDAPSDVLLGRLDAVAARVGPGRDRGLPGSAVPRVIKVIDTDERLVLSRAALTLLLAIDTRRTIYDLSTLFGVAHTLATLTTLTEFGLIELDTPSELSGKTGVPLLADETGPRQLTVAPIAVQPVRVERWRVTRRVRSVARLVALGMVLAIILLAITQVVQRGTPGTSSTGAASTPVAAPVLSRQVEPTAASLAEPTVEPAPSAVPTEARQPTPGPIAAISTPSRPLLRPTSPANLSTDLRPADVASQPTSLPLQQRGATSPRAAWEAETVDPRAASESGQPAGPNWTTTATYRLTTATPGAFLAIRATLPQAVGDTSIRASFTKVGGSSGGGYGLIVHDQGPDPRDGMNQLGRFYVFEVGDKGEVGIWRRDLDHWVDLLPWAPAAPVRPGLATNRLRVDAVGDHYTFSVNGVPVADGSDGTLANGQVGVFIGGDLNDVLLEGLVVGSP